MRNKKIPIRFKLRVMNIRRYVLIPLVVLIIALVGTCGLVLALDARAKTERQSARTFRRVHKDFHAALADRAAAMDMAMDAISNDEILTKAFAKKNTSAVLAQARPIFAKLLTDHNITHFYFIGTDRVCFLRIHQPGRYGDKIDRFTAKEAEQTGKTAWGIELGPLGTFTLRVVQPWYNKGKLIGYLELGEEIEHIITQIQHSLGVDFVIGIDKQFLNREAWEQGQKMMHRRSDWNRFPSFVITNNTMDKISPALMAQIGQGEHEHITSGQEISIAGHDYRMVFHELMDAGHRRVGEMAVLQDFSASHASLIMTIVQISVICVAIGTIIVVFLYFFLGWIQRKYARQSDTIRENQETMRTLLDALDDVALLLHTDGTIIAANQTAEREMGLDSGEISGRFIHDLLPDEAASEITSHIELTISTGKPVEYEQQIGGRWFVNNIFPINNIAGKVARVAVYSRDITDAKLAEEKLQQATARAETLAAEAKRADQIKSEFLANMSHEIRTPMTAILGFTEQLKSPQLTREERDEYLDIIARNGRHLLGLINDILDLSKIEADKISIERIPCNPASVIADVVSLMRGKTAQRRVGLYVRYDGKIPQTIQTDPTRLRQILLNLVGNAVKFTDKGDIQIIVNFLPSWRNGKPAIRIGVIDDGIGMSEKVLAKIFTPFKQGDSSTSRRYGGTGLGLAISHKFAELLGGELTASSISGQGSEFTLTIPTGDIRGVPMLSDQAEALNGKEHDVQQDPSDTAPLDGLRILLAEDGRDNQLLIGTILRQAGAEVEVVINGLQAVQRAGETEAEKFDLILMDMQMPEMDGYEATQKLRTEGLDTPIIALTANAMREDRQKCINAGCTDYCTKPIDRSHLIQTIARYVDRKPACPDNQASCPATQPKDSSQQVIRSQFESDPCLTTILAGFVTQLPQTIQEMHQASANGLFEQVGRSAHQLKGAGGGYGYPQLSELGAAMEQAAKMQDAEAITLLLDKLRTLCLAIQAGLAPVGEGKDMSS
ncbi:MAG: hypothetical protein DRP83_05685 [Planctomycetota bacterium]|nr:MAG: hypothetical protein DRP83_05685 [Planctomycetota bacterium]